MTALVGVAGAVTAVTGFEKGSGKTTFLSFLMPHARRAGPVGVFTIGSDSGPGTRQAARVPEIRVEPGDVVLTTEPLARASQARFEILETVPGRAAQGRLHLGRARRAGGVALVGAEHFSALGRALAQVRAEGWAASILIDGSVNRITQVSALGDLQFAWTVRADRNNLARVASRMRFLERVARLPLDSPDPEGRVRVEGPLTAEGLRALPAGTRGFSVEDFTKIFVEPAEFLKALERYEVRVRRGWPLLLFAVILRNLGREEFLAAVGPEVGSRVLFNPHEVP